MLTDTHCHLDASVFDADRLDVLDRARQAGVSRILIPGLDLRSSQRALQLSQEHPLLFAAVGIHPTEADDYDGASWDALHDLAIQSKVVAIGEIGLDYYWVKEQPRQARQRQILQDQLRLAADLRKPVVIHARESGDAEDGPCSEDLLTLLEEWVHGFGAFGGGPSVPGVLHSFGGSILTARRAIELGFYIGVTGPLTYKKAESRRATIASLPLERLLIETDSPYLAPHPYRGKRNEPAYVAHIADKIADIQSRTPQEVAAVTGDNAARLFSWGDTD